MGVAGIGFRHKRPQSVVILGGRSGWLATPRREGPCIDESRFAAVGEISRRLAAGYDLGGTVN